MDVATRSRFEDKFVQAGDYRIRYIEQGEGPHVVLIHGSSLGSSADVFLRNIGPLADAGFHVVALDMPGYGLSDYSEDGSAGLKKKTVLGVMDALDIDRAALIGHSSAGNVAVAVALDRPDRVTRVMVLGTGSLLPPLEGGAGRLEGRAQARLETRMSASEPTLEDTRKLLEANLFHLDLITDDELALRHSRSIGPCFKAFVARTEAARAAKAAAPADSKPVTPMWQRARDLAMPLLMIYGREDRARAADRAELLKKMHPEVDLHMAEGCKHLVPWDAEDLFHSLAIPFLKAV